MNRLAVPRLVPTTSVSESSYAVVCSSFYTNTFSIVPASWRVTRCTTVRTWRTFLRCLAIGKWIVAHWQMDMYGALTNFLTCFFRLSSSIATTSVYMHASKSNVSNYIDLTDIGTGVDSTIEYKPVKKEKKKSKRPKSTKIE